MWELMKEVVGTLVLLALAIIGIAACALLVLLADSIPL